MLTKAKPSSKDLLFEQNIEKNLRFERKKLKQNQEDSEKKEDQTSPNSQSHTTQTEKMVENRNNEDKRIVNPSRRMLGDYAIQQGPRHFSSIVMPTVTRSLEMKPTFFILINNHQFTGMDH